ncbi:MAG: Serine/threonine-protein kinase plk4 [Paramarteilia canceri]
MDKYQIIEKLGQGSSGEVYKARNLLKNCNVALKKISKQKIALKPDLANRVRQEVSIQHQLKHPGIVELLEFFETDDQICLIQELCTGGTLRNFMKTYGPTLTISKRQKMFGQILEAIIYLQQHSIAHRDLSWTNVLVSENLSLKLADFGLAVKLPKFSEQTTLCGTPDFIAPEVLSGKPYNLSPDLWSLGAILFVLFFGHPPPKLHSELLFMPTYTKYDSGIFSSSECFFKDIKIAKNNIEFSKIDKLDTFGLLEYSYSTKNGTKLFIKTNRWLRIESKKSLLDISPDGLKIFERLIGHNTSRIYDLNTNCSTSVYKLYKFASK